MSEKSRANLNRTTVPEVIPLMQAVYERHCAGCCAHIVTDDDNCGQDSAEFCLAQARRNGHADCIALCEALVQMTPTQRHRLYLAPRRPFIPEVVRGEQ